MKRLHRFTGFTLLELMLAVTILSLVMLSIYATWNAGLSGWKRTVGVSDNFQRERIVMSTLSELTKSIVFLPGSQDDLYEVRFERDAQMGPSISFVTASDLLLPPTELMSAGMRRVTIAMERDQYGRSYLGISNSPALETDDQVERVVHVLCTEVSGFGIRFRDASTGSMSDDWQDPDTVPVGIEFTIAFGANDGRVPPIVMTRSVEIPVAPYVLQLAGKGMATGNLSEKTKPPQPSPLPPRGGSGIK